MGKKIKWEEIQVGKGEGMGSKERGEREGKRDGEKGQELREDKVMKEKEEGIRVETKFKK